MYWSRYITQAVIQVHYNRASNHVEQDLSDNPTTNAPAGKGILILIPPASVSSRLLLDALCLSPRREGVEMEANGIEIIKIGIPCIFVNMNGTLCKRTGFIFFKFVSYLHQKNVCD